jgi:hypothetical protein
MKMTTGRIANPRKRRAPARRKAARRRKTTTTTTTTTRRSNPSHRMGAVIPASAFAMPARKSNPSRRRKASAGTSGVFMSPRGHALARRRNPSGSGVVAGVSISETAIMVLSGGAAAFAGAIVVRFVDERLPSKWARVGAKFGAALVTGFLGMKAAESKAMGGRVVLPIAIGFAAPMIASALEDVFAGGSGASTTATRAMTVPDVDDDDDDDASIDGLDPMDDIDDDVASLYDGSDDDMEGYDDDMDGFGPQSALMGSTVHMNPTLGLSSFSANFMQGLTGKN